MTNFQHSTSENPGGGLTQPIHDVVFGVFLPELLVLVATSALTLTSSLLLVRLKKLKEKISNEYLATKTRKLKVSEFDKIKGILTKIILETKINRASVLLLNKYQIENGDVVAESFSVAVQVVNGVPEIGIFDEKFGYISQAINDLYENNIKYKWYNSREDGYVCAAWLRDRKTKSYGVFILDDTKGLILLEQKQSTSFYNIFNRKNHDQWVDKCKEIDEFLK